MLLRPTREDVAVIGAHVGLALQGVGLGTALVAVLAVILGDVNSATGLTVGAACGIGLGSWVRLGNHTRSPLSWTRGVVTATVSWASGSVIAAIPLYLSGHYANFVDALFEAMSGLTTTGLTMVQDLDHLPAAIGMYRHMLELIGGVAIVVTGLTILTAPTATRSSLAPSDARDERILPKPGRVWRQVATVFSVTLGVGATICTVAVAVAGMRGWRAVSQGVGLAISAATTGGFAGMSTSLAYFHSALVEASLVPLMLAGALSFTLYRATRRDGLIRQFEIRTFLASFTVLAAIVLIGLGRSGSQTDLVPLLRRGLFTTIAAHTTTGLQIATPRLVATDWGQLAPAALVAAMTIGGMTGSTAGGLKVLRIGALAKGLVADVKRVLLPESARVVSTFTWDGPRRLEHAHVRSAATMLLIFLAAVMTGAVAILFVDGSVNLTEALFAATSAASNSGQSLGVIEPASPEVLKLGFVFLMLLGRLEWMAVFATVGFGYAGLRGRA